MTIFSLHRPEQFLALVPALLGERPESALVVAGMRGVHTRALLRLRLPPLARDAPAVSAEGAARVPRLEERSGAGDRVCVGDRAFVESAAGVACVEGAVGGLCRIPEADHVIAVFYTPRVLDPAWGPDALPGFPLIDRVLSRFDAAGFHLHDALCVGRGSVPGYDAWASYLAPAHALPVRHLAAGRPREAPAGRDAAERDGAERGGASPVVPVPNTLVPDSAVPDSVVPDPAVPARPRPWPGAAEPAPGSEPETGSMESEPAESAATEPGATESDLPLRDVAVTDSALPGPTESDLPPSASAPPGSAPSDSAVTDTEEHNSARPDQEKPDSKNLDSKKSGATVGEFPLRDPAVPGSTESDLPPPDSVPSYSALLNSERPVPAVSRLAGALPAPATPSAGRRTLPTPAPTPSPAPTLAALIGELEAALERVSPGQARALLLRPERFMLRPERPIPDPRAPTPPSVTPRSAARAATPPTAARIRTGLGAPSASDAAPAIARAPATPAPAVPPPHEGSPGTGEIPSLVELAEHALTLAPPRIAPAVRALLGTVLHDGPLRDVLLHTWAWGPAAGWDLIADLEAHPPRLLRGLRYLCGDAPTPPIPHRLHRSRLLCSHLGNTLPETRREGAREAGAWLAWAAGDLAETQRLLGHPGAPHANPRFVHTLKNVVNRGEKPRWGCISGNPQ